MEFLPNGYTLEIAPGSFPLSTDSMALAWFAALPKHARILDLGSGCGTLGLLLCARDAACRVTGVELSESAHAAALENIRRNALEGRLESICADLRQVSQLFSPGRFSCIVSNPPYFSGGAASRALPNARQEVSCCLSDLLRSAGWALKYGGDFFLVHKPERLGEILTEAAKNALEAKRLCLLRHREDGPISLILLQLRKGGKPGLHWEEIALYHKDGSPTEAYRKIYHIEEA